MLFAEHVFENITTLAGIAFLVMSAPTLIPAVIRHRHRLKRQWPWIAFAAVFFAFAIFIRLFS